MAKDPVCGMEVDEENAGGSSTYKGQSYYFCAKACKNTFYMEPEKYLAGEKGHSPGETPEEAWENSVEKYLSAVKRVTATERAL